MCGWIGFHGGSSDRHRRRGPTAGRGRRRGTDAARTWDADLAELVDLLRTTPADAAVGNWSIAPPPASLGRRGAPHELAAHRWDAGTALDPSPAPIAVGLACDGIAEFFEVFVATGLAAGMVAPAAVTLVLEPTDGGPASSSTSPTRPRDRPARHHVGPAGAVALAGSARPSS